MLVDLKNSTLSRPLLKCECVCVCVYVVRNLQLRLSDVQLNACCERQFLLLT